jgi:DDE superfamily endonuclease
MTSAEGREMSVLQNPCYVESLDVLSRFRTGLYGCLTARADALFELADAVLCADGPVHSLVELTLVAEHRRGHGAMYDALNHGGIDVGRLRRALARLPLPRFEGRRLVLAVDVTPWLRPDAGCSPDRLFCHTYGRASDDHQMIPGWPYSWVAVLEPGRTSWTAVLDAVRLGPDDDVAAVTAAQLREVVQRLIDEGQHLPGDPDILIVADAGYDLPRLAVLLADLPVTVLGRLRSDRVFYRPAPPRSPYQRGRPAHHGGAFRFADPATWHTAQVTTVTDTDRYGKAQATAWDRMHPKLARRCAWLDHDGDLPVVEGTVIRLQVQRLPRDRTPDPVWLWCAATNLTPSDVDQMWQMFLRRFDLEHTFRLFKQTLGWTKPKLRTCEAADRWTWLTIGVYTQLHLARPLAQDLRKPWEKPLPANRLTPARVRRGFRNIRPHAGSPASAPKFSRPGPGRPPGSKNRQPAVIHHVGKTVKREKTLTAKRQQEG